MSGDLGSQLLTFHPCTTPVMARSQLNKVDFTGRALVTPLFPSRIGFRSPKPPRCYGYIEDPVVGSWWSKDLGGVSVLVTAIET